MRPAAIANVSVRLNGGQFGIFAENVEKKELCKVKYTERDLQLLRDAIEDLYYFEFVIGK